MSLAKRIARKILGPRYLARRAMKREIAEGEREIRLIPVLADRQGVFLDAGANQGSYALCALPHFAQVIAVEAHPDLARLLRRVLEPRGKVMQLALSDEAGRATLHVPVRDEREVTTRCSLNAAANPGFDLRPVEVVMATIDSLAVERLSVIKIDVEGHEHAVLRGAGETIARCRPVCIVECEERHNPGGVARTFEMFEGWGYQSHFIHRGSLRPGDEFDRAVLQQAENCRAGLAGG